MKKWRWRNNADCFDVDIFILVVIWVGFLIATMVNWVKGDIISANKTCISLCVVAFIMSIINLIIHFIK